MKRDATAVWKGALVDGAGTLTMQSGAFKDAPYSFKSRFQDEQPAATNPEELIAAAHAGCFAMQLSHFLAEAGHPAEELRAKAVVSLDPQQGGGFSITRSDLRLDARVPGIDEAKFRELADKAKAACPVSRALGAIQISLDTRLA